MAASHRNHDSSDSDSSDNNDLSTANNPGSAQVQVTSNSQVGVGSQGRKVERTWRLEQGQMRVIDFSKSARGNCMNVKMEFTLRDGVKKIVDLPYTTEARKRCRELIFARCEKYISLEGVSTSAQDKHFPEFIDQQLKIWADNRLPADNNRKETLELSSPSIELIGDKYYWIAGAEEVHLLNHMRSIGDKTKYSKKLSTEEISELPVDLIYLGSDTTVFVNDEEEAFTKLVGIIYKMNLMQDPQFVSFPLASFVSHLSAFLYKILRPMYKGFSTTMTLSGSGNTHSTGKSLWTSLCQLMLLGDWPRQMATVTPSNVFGELEAGRNIYLREWSKPLVGVMNQAIKMVWEQLGRMVRDKYQPVNGVLMIDANLSPVDIQLDHANESKVIFIATGSKPLEHDNRIQLCQEMEDLARELFYYLPVIISLGLSNMMKKVTDVETRIYDGILNTDRDDRQAQVFINYDRVHGAVEEAIDDYGLPKPILFQKIPIDRTALTFYSKRKDTPSLEEMAKMIVNHFMDNHMDDFVEYSAKTKSFRLKIDPSDTPEDVARAIRNCTKVTSTVFGGKLGVKVRLLSSSLLSAENLAKMRSLSTSIKFADAVERMLANKAATNKVFGREFYKQVRRRANRVLGQVDDVPEQLNDAPEEIDKELVDEILKTDLTEKDFFEIPPGPSHQHPVPLKKRKATPPDELVCDVIGCPSAATGHVYKNINSFRKHQSSVSHLKAEKLSGMFKKKSRKKRS